MAYARQLHDQSDLPAGGFETQFSFAQVLTESAKLARSCLLVISLPASDTGGSPHTQADDVEVGGQRGREALDRLRNVVGRVESSWRPASAEEGFEIVRRRLFEPLADSSQFRDRDVVARTCAPWANSAGSIQCRGRGKRCRTTSTRFHGTVVLEPTRVSRDASRIADEVIAHLSGLIGAKVQVTLEVDAEIPSGAPDQVVRTVTENSRTLKFTNQGFEKEQTFAGCSQRAFQHYSERRHGPGPTKHPKLWSAVSCGL